MSNGAPRSVIWGPLETEDKVNLIIDALDKFDSRLDSFEQAVDKKLAAQRRLQWAQLSATGLFLLGLVANLVVLLAGAYGR